MQIVRGERKIREKAKKKELSERERKIREKAKKKELEKPVWNPCIERVDADVQDSVASMLAKTTRRKLQVSQPCFMSVSTLAK